MKPTLKKNLPIEEYHSNDGAVSTSKLKLLMKSPFHFKHPVDKESSAFDIGHAVHTKLLEPHNWDKYFAVYDPSKRPVPESNFNKKENREWKDEFYEKNEGKIILSEDQVEIIDLMIERALENKMIVDLLSGPGWNEASIYWMDWKRKIKLKTRPDRISANMIIADVKTASDASPDGFMKALGNWRYDMQAAMQIDGVEAYFKKKVTYYFYIVIETKPPYANAVYLLKPDTIWTGRNSYKQLLDILSECREKDEWPSYDYWARNKPDKILRTELPHYTKLNLFQ